MLVLENSNELRVAKDLVSEHYYFAYKSRSGLAGCLKNLMIHLENSVQGEFVPLNTK